MQVGSWADSELDTGRQYQLAVVSEGGGTPYLESRPYVEIINGFGLTVTPDSLSSIQIGIPETNTSNLAIQGTTDSV